ncbi:MAG: phenylalanine--tRNA ligase subunit alpha [Myxococcota bacterium]|nr:phenylalanine--tRNA ligase subunit alpha [Myxococcota bacterium]
MASAQSLAALAEIRAGFLGKKGSVSSLLRGIGALAPEERARVGEAANVAKERIEGFVRERREILEREAHASALAAQRLDVTLPGVRPPRGHLHPITQIERDIVAFFHGLGFSVEEGPEVETQWNNFEALGIAPDHPARDMQATFFVDGGHVLRTHTSPVQIRAMTGRQPPFRFIVPGRVYRNDRSPRHSPMFHQVEGFMVDERVSFADLKGILYAFQSHMMGAEVELRFRASYFPFTEPSAELDYRCLLCQGAGCATCSQSGWIEAGGCGMIHPTVLANCGIDAERWQGFAFGMTLDRAAMLRWGIPNIHLLFEGDLRVLEQLG